MAQDTEALVREYGHQDIKCRLFGVSLSGITGIKYDDKQEKKFFFGAGKEAVSYGLDGNYEASGELTMLHSEYIAIQKAFPEGKTFTDAAPSDITVTFEADNVTDTITDVLKDCIFTGQGKESKVGQSGMEVKIPFKCRKIVYNFKS